MTSWTRRARRHATLRRSTRASRSSTRERDRDDGDPKWLDSLVECERTRDGVVQRLLDAVTVLGQLDMQAIRGTDEYNGPARRARRRDW